MCNFIFFQNNSVKASHRASVSLNYSQFINIIIGGSNSRPTVSYWRLSDFWCAQWVENTYIILSKNCYQIIDHGFWIYINLKFRWRYLCRSAFLSGLFILPIFDNAKLSSWIMLSSLSWRSKSRMHHRFVSSKFYCVWLIFRKIALDQGKKSSATSKMSPMGSFSMFPHHIIWKAGFLKLSR